MPKPPLVQNLNFCALTGGPVVAVTFGRGAQSVRPR